MQVELLQNDADNRNKTDYVQYNRELDDLELLNNFPNFNLREILERSPEELISLMITKLDRNYHHRHSNL